jgi:hypothetical protein
MQGEVIDGAPARYGVENGELVVHAAHSKWIDDQHAFYLWKEVKGDFVATMRLSVSGEHGAIPTADWSLAGLLVRAPQASSENWIDFTVGRAPGKSVFERKSTRSTHSILVLNPAPTGWLELRQVRIGNRFYLLRRRRSWEVDRALDVHPARPAGDAAGRLRRAERLGGRSCRPARSRRLHALCGDQLPARLRPGCSAAGPR